MPSFRRDLPAYLSIAAVIGCLAVFAWAKQMVATGAVVNAAPVTATPITTPAWYELHFTTPLTTALLERPTGGIPARLAATFDQTQQTLDVAVYEFDLPVVAQALVRAHTRGVRVRLVTDSDTLAEPVVQDLITAGIPVVADNRSAIMHNKFAVLDGASVWTGSLNFTYNDAYRNNNNFIWIQSKTLAANYTHEFEEMFTAQAFGPRSPADTPNPTVEIAGTRVENYFAPEDDVARRVLPLLQNAQHSVYFLAFSFTRADFASALIAQGQSGRTVRGVFETRQIAAGSDEVWLQLSAAGLPVRQDGNPYNLHSKVFIIDLQTVVLGSYNFSASADESNDENVLIIHNRAIALAYYEEWLKVWEVAAK